MSTNSRIADLLRQRAEIDMKLAEEYEALDREPAQNAVESSQWVKLKEYCEMRKMGESTVRRHIRDGMPHRELGPRNIRINVAAADAWLEARAEAHRRKRGKAA